MLKCGDEDSRVGIDHAINEHQRDDREQNHRVRNSSGPAARSACVILARALSTGNSGQCSSKLMAAAWLILSSPTFATLAFAGPAVAVFGKRTIRSSGDIEEISASASAVLWPFCSKTMRTNRGFGSIPRPRIVR